MWQNVYSQAGNRRQGNTAHALCMLIIKATDRQDMQYLLSFHDKNFDANASQCYINHSLLVVFIYIYIYRERERERERESERERERDRTIKT
jgi:hypothetical protein